MRTLLALLTLLPLCAEPSIQDIQDAIHRMAVHQADTHRNIGILNDKLSNLVLDIRAHRINLDEATSTHVIEIFKENAVLFVVLQDYYARENPLFDYLKGILQGYKGIAKEMSSNAPLQKFMPLMHEIISQLQTMVVLEKHIDTLID
ncbi:hypothetical protein [Helicobacter salomonis]|uniref:hypothetical protein n=1 Tax=Helicobacter salomonis TaxID=56878 RepID=UPI000CF08E77|nr:hypothetical protein [Helicobacter salomonis]